MTELTKQALEVKRAYQREWREKNREELRQYYKDYRQKNKDKTKESNINYWNNKAKQLAE